MFTRFLRCFDNPAALLVVTVAILLTLGSVVLYSASGARAGFERIRIQATQETRAEEDYRFHHSAAYVIRQSFWALLGIGVACGLLRVRMETFEKYALPIFIGTLLLMVMVSFTPLGVEAKGARRWLRLGPFTIQPSEFARIGLVILIAQMLAAKRENLNDFFRGLAPSIIALGAFSVLVALQRDFGAFVVMGLVTVSLWLMAHVKLRHLGILMVPAVAAVLFLVFQYSYRMNRILSVLYPERFADTIGYQLNQSLLAVGSGGLFGQGLGLGMQKYHFLPESHTDFIFAIVAEELGFAGAASMVLLFLAFVLLGIRISYRAPDYFSGLLAAGITLVIGFSAFANFLVVLGLAPTKGLPLPFVSYGGSSMIASLAATAILVVISNHTLEVRGSREVL